MAQIKASGGRRDGARDQVYAAPHKAVEAFRFDAQVADVFQDMISRSVPGYAFFLDFIAVMSSRYARADTQCYDLGAALGASTLQIRRHSPASCRVIAVDNSEAMVERCRLNLAQDDAKPECEVRCEDIRDTLIEKASIVALNFTLQFLPDEERLPILKTICAGMVPGGALLLAEKLRFADAGKQALMTDLHHEFKRCQGYSDLEIAQKRAALEEVLVPNTLDEHLHRLTEAGFAETQVCIQNLNFAGLLAVK
ncbi:MAG: carboxy-S-adenosyl-L-methionine synthase CmoA [Pseudomonadales bacterium]